ncbi:MAG: hypothetical protein RL272_227 [Candidatus Parcubacteria bacterium]|jgi:NTE family protein
MSKKTALVLSGGGAKGAFQVGAEKYARQAKGYRWDVIAGVSIGAFNGAMLAMGRHKALEEFWNTLTPERLYGRSNGHAMHIARRLVLRKASFYENDPVREFIDKEVHPSRMAVDLRVGAVSLASGEYRSFRASHPHFMQALLASMALPPLFPPVLVGSEYMIDGGFRKVCPISDALDAEPDEIVVINCNPMRPPAAAETPAHAFGISQIAASVSMHQIFRNDVKKFLLINRLVAQAEASGAALMADDGRRYRNFPAIIIEPDAYTGETTDLSPAHVRRAFDAGWEKAKKVLG